MKLGQLNAAIRALKGAPKMAAKFKASDQVITVEITKQSLLEALKLSFPGGRSVETYACLSADGFLVNDAGDQAWETPTATADEDVEDPLDDLLG